MRILVFIYYIYKYTDGYNNTDGDDDDGDDGDDDDYDSDDDDYDDDDSDDDNDDDVPYLLGLTTSDVSRNIFIDINLFSYFGVISPG